MICWKRYTLGSFRKWGVCSFLLKNGNYRFSNKIPELLCSYLDVFTVLCSFKHAGRIFDHSVSFAKIFAMQIGKLSGKNIFTVSFSFSSEGQTVFPIYSYYSGWRLILRTFETIPLKCAMFLEGFLMLVPLSGLSWFFSFGMVVFIKEKG